MKAWLYSIARRVASNYRRSARRADARAEAFAVVEGHARPAVPEAILALDRVLEALTAQERELFVLSEVEGMTGPEIAAAWGLNLNTVYTRIRKLRATVHAASLPTTAAEQRPRPRAGAWAALLPALTPAKAASSSLWLLLAAALAASTGLGSVALRRNDDPAARSRSAPVRVQSTGATARPPAQPAEPEPMQPAATAPRSVQPTALPGSRPSRPSQPVEAAPSTLSQENALLEDARAALRRGDAAQALEHTSAHAKAFPQGSLRDVRDVVRIEALCALNKAPQARAEAVLLLERRPGITAKRRLEKTCAAAPQNPANPDMTGA
ncbi:MAG: sigma-70 family RNA polymerase sigma factor [Myxococcota bacterium]